MASAARSAPLPESSSALVKDPQFQEILQRSRSLTQKILDSIPDTHKSCVHTEMQKMTQMQAVVPPMSTSVELRLPGDYDVQVAAHLTLDQLQAFSQDVARCLRSLDLSNDDEKES
ncbi:hypothetical protein GOODEAATRI_029059 [Goodea atripinnis]|uniref:Uncharacterized protein n=1 Tax=Goodea atripinnis TaxID=208336 RepID=A0ABV0MLN5_9TELE